VSLDQIAVLQAAEQGEGMVTESTLVTNLGWEARRARVALDQLVGAGLVWVDTQGSEKEYWVASIFTSRITGA